tara:strand:- start:47132 stop:47308 length:177 start_codon:yes stop_codon:yes gene_type:complete
MFGGKGIQNWKIEKLEDLGHPERSRRVGGFRVEGSKVEKLESGPTSLFKIQRWTFIVF